MTTDDRTPPAHLRICNGLQETHLADLVRLDQQCAGTYHAGGFDAAEVPVRSAYDFVSLARQNSVKVAEADHAVAGFLAWHDEAPGVAYLVDIQVHPDLQRFGIGSKLLGALRDEARELGFEHVVVRCWERAPWAMAFYRRQRFMPIDATAPAKVALWRDDRLATGKPLTRPGEVALWSPIGPVPRPPWDEEEDLTLLTGAEQRRDG
jgi:amino-acid N-acetyltransferase